MKKLLCLSLILLSMFVNAYGENVNFIEAQYGEDKPMVKRVLVAYASKAGSTAEVADFIGKNIADKGAVVDVKKLENVKGIAGYNAIVIGNAVRAGKLLSEAADFVKHHKAEMQKIPVAYFVVCMTLKDNTEENRKKANSFLDPLCAEITPMEKGLFAGKMDYSKLGFATKTVVKHIVKVPEGDFRDWDAIKKWANEVSKKIL
jgi:menaquinone-dependent protoporphyrinogen oxidase